jgi:hypothetical protein
MVAMRLQHYDFTYSAYNSPFSYFAMRVNRLQILFRKVRVFYLSAAHGLRRRWIMEISVQYEFNTTKTVATLFFKKE